MYLIILLTVKMYSYRDARYISCFSWDYTFTKYNMRKLVQSVNVISTFWGKILGADDKFQCVCFFSVLCSALKVLFVGFIAFLVHQVEKTLIQISEYKCQLE